MPNYQNGKIYKIWCGDDTYYGSTTRTLAQRMTKHREGFRHNKKMKCSSLVLFEKYGMENCKIELVELFPCQSNEELTAREGFYVRNNACVNKVVPDGTMKEWYDKNKERMNTTRRESPRIVCECGGYYVISMKKRHERTKKHQNATDQLCEEVG